MKERKSQPKRTRGELPHFQQNRNPIIIVPLSDAPESKAALPVATAVAKLGGLTMHILHVTAEPISVQDLLRHLGLTPQEVRGMLLDQAAGPIASTIAKVAKEKKARLIVMATFGYRKPLSPTAEGVLKRADCPVLFVRPEVPRRGRMRNILLPLDGTPTTAAAVGPAMVLAQHSNINLDILYVVEPGVGHPKEPGTITAPRYIDQPQHEWPAWSREFLARFFEVAKEAGPPGPAHLFLRLGDPAEEIVRFASENEVDLIVLVWGGEFRGKRATTIKGVLSNAPCPVLVLHAKQT